MKFRLLALLLALCGYCSVANAVTVQSFYGTGTQSTTTVSSLDDSGNLTLRGFVSLFPQTTTQIAAIVTPPIGATAWCSNCNANGGKGTFCTSTQAVTGLFSFVLSTGSVCQ